MTALRHHYRLYGLQIGSNVPIHGLPEYSSDRGDDIQLIDGLMPLGLDANSRRWRPNDRFAISASAPLSMANQSLSLSDDGSYLQWRYDRQIVFVFHLDGSRMWVQWADDMDAPLRAFNIFGPAMGMALKLRGLTALHASVVDIGGQALAFAGVSGSGKSTLAATFEQMGYHILSDDLCVLLPTDQGIIVPSGPPRIRLLPDAATALYGEIAGFHMSPDGEKLEHQLRWVTTAFGEAHLPLSAVYYLAGRADQTSINPVATRDALFLLLNNAYLSYVSDARMRANTFSTLSAFVQLVPTFSLVSLAGHRELNKLCRELVSRHS